MSRLGRSLQRKRRSLTTQKMLRESGPMSGKPLAARDGQRSAVIEELKNGPNNGTKRYSNTHRRREMAKVTISASMNLRRVL